MQTATKKFVTLFMSLSLFAAFVCALSLISASTSKTAALLSPTASAAPVTNQADIIFRTASGQTIGGGSVDRVARGEQFTVIVRAHQYPICVQVRAANGFQRQIIAHSEFRFTDRVPTNPSFDDVIVTALSLDGHRLAQRRLPIGRR